MPDSPEVQELLDELLASEATPEEVCRSCPELLPRIRTRWRQICRAQRELDALFPPGLAQAADAWPRSEALPRITGYAVEAVLGRGGVGIVFRARDLRLGRPVALKMLLAGSYAGPTELARFQREAEAIAGLCHPNIVQIHEVGDHEGRPYFTMELVDGGTLAQKLAGALQPVRWAAELVAALARAVAVAHSAGLIHRDLKPGNILLTADGSPKISDFGLARRQDDVNLTRTGTAVGTPSYMAPEQASDAAGPVGPATDVYGLGAILYELLTGRPPFCAKTALETFQQVLADDPVAPSRLNPRVPRDLETVCLKCLQKEPHQRYPSASALAEDLQRYLLGQVVAARPVGHLERVGKWIKRNPTVALLSGAAALALVAGTVASALFAGAAFRQAHLATERAGELEQQARALEVQTRTAEANARRAAEKENEAARALAEVERVLVAGLLIPIGRNGHLMSITPIDPAEADALCQLRAASPHVRVLFLETALRDPESAQRVGRRPDWVIQALVGHDRALRADAGRVLVRRIQEPAVPQEVALACARLGLALNLDDRVWVGRAAEVLGVALCDPLTEREDYPSLAEALATVSEHLPPTRAADHASRALDALFAVLREPNGRLLAHQYFGRAVVALSRHLEAGAATRAAEALGAVIRESGSFPPAWTSFAEALAALCRRLPPSEAAAVVKGTVDFLIEGRSTTKTKAHHLYYARALSALRGHLDAGGVARVAGALTGALSETEPLVRGLVAETLSGVAGRLDAPEALRAAETLVGAMRQSGPPVGGADHLRAALVSVCRRLDADGLASTAEALAAAVRDPETPGPALAPLADALAVVLNRLEPARAESVERASADALIARLADPKAPSAGGVVARALGSVCGRPGATGAARAAKALTTVIRDPQTPLEALGPLASALAVVCGQLDPREASCRAEQAVDVLDSLWATRTGPPERFYLAQALAAVWVLLDPTEAAARANRVAIDLAPALRDSTTSSSELHRLAGALSVVCGHLGPAERIAHANSAVDALSATLRARKNDMVTTAVLPDALATLGARLDGPGTARVADNLLTTLGDPAVQRYGTFIIERTFKTIAPRLEERDLQRFLERPLAAGALQRTILDALGGARNLHFRNTWDYLDRTGTNR
jgi:hypothetical protein